MKKDQFKKLLEKEIKTVLKEYYDDYLHGGHPGESPVDTVKQAVSKTNSVQDLKKKSIVVSDILDDKEGGRVVANSIHDIMQAVESIMVNSKTSLSSASSIVAALKLSLIPLQVELDKISR